MDETSLITCKLSSTAALRLIIRIVWPNAINNGDLRDRTKQDTVGGHRGDRLVQQTQKKQSSINQARPWQEPTEPREHRASRKPLEEPRARNIGEETDMDPNGEEGPRQTKVSVRHQWPLILKEIQRQKKKKKKKCEVKIQFVYNVKRRATIFNQ